MDWFRWHHGSVTDPKFQLVAKKASASVAEVVAVWAYVLEMASQNTKRGHVDALDCEAIDLALGMSDGKTEAILAVLSDRGILAEGRIAAWEKRQPKREDDSANDRKRRQREREHELSLAAVTEAVSRNVTQCHAASRAVTPEEKREEEKDQEQEQKRKGGRSAPPLVLPDWLSADAWDSWHRFRNGRKGWTADAKALSLRSLAKLRDEGHDPLAVIEQSIERGWTGLFPLRGEFGPGARGSPQRSTPPSKQIQAMHAILGIPDDQSSDASRVVLDIHPAGLGADIRQLPQRLPGG